MLLSVFDMKSKQKKMCLCAILLSVLVVLFQPVCAQDNPNDDPFY